MPVRGCLQKKFIDWEIPDPRNMDENEFRKVRDLIENKVKELLKGDHNIAS